MPTLKIDNQDITVEPGSTILHAARKLGLDIPALCHREDLPPNTSCLACVVRVNGAPRLVPSCATKVADGMKVESETPEVRAARRMAMELLLADHAGDCMAPCQNVCPAHMDIPRMLRHIGNHEFRDAVIVVKEHIALPAVLGRICPELCEKGCRRGNTDDAVSICSLKRFVADTDLESPTPYLPPKLPDSGKKVAVVGAGPAGLAAAWYLLQWGHSVTIFDDHPLPGGNLRYAVSKEILPDKVLDAEIDLIKRQGATFQMNTRVGSVPAENKAANCGTGAPPVAGAAGASSPSPGTPAEGKAANCGTGAPPVQTAQPNPQSATRNPQSETPRFLPLPDLRKQFNAVLLTVGEVNKDKAASIGIPLMGKGLKVDKNTKMTPEPGVFGAGGSLTPLKHAVRAVREGREAAYTIHQYLQGRLPAPEKSDFTVRLGVLNDAEQSALDAHAPKTGRQSSHNQLEGLMIEAAVAQAQRCLHCDCEKLDDCKLRKYAAEYEANPKRYPMDRRPFERIETHESVVYEPGKCISCGLCVAIASAAKEPLGLTFVGRGFALRIKAPFNKEMSEALQKVAEEVCQSCPTAALTLKSQPQKTPCART